MNSTELDRKYLKIESIIKKMSDNSKHDPRDAITIVDLLEIEILVDEMEESINRISLMNNALTMVDIPGIEILVKRMKDDDQMVNDLNVLRTYIQRAHKMQEDNPSEIKKEDLVASKDIPSLILDMQILLDVIESYQKNHRQYEELLQKALADGTELSSGLERKYLKIESIIKKMSDNSKHDPRDAITIVDLLEIESLVDKMKESINMVDEIKESINRTSLMNHALTMVDITGIERLVKRMKDDDQMVNDLTVLREYIQQASKMREANPSEIKKEDLVASKDIPSLILDMQILLDVIETYQENQQQYKKLLQKAFTDGTELSSEFEELSLESELQKPSSSISSLHITKENLAHATVFK